MCITILFTVIIKLNKILNEILKIHFFPGNCNVWLELRSTALNWGDNHHVKLQETISRLPHLSSTCVLYHQMANFSGNDRK
jgi:hypothetical protein